MPFIEASKEDRELLKLACEEARLGYQEGGVPVGAVLARGREILARGRNRLVQQGNPVLHGETDCIRQYGRGRDFRGTTLYTSLSPCAMCAGAVILFGIPRVVIADDRNFPGEVEWLLRHGIEIAISPDKAMIAFFRDFTESHPEIWSEDIKGYPAAKEA